MTLTEIKRYLVFKVEHHEVNSITGIVMYREPYSDCSPSPEPEYDLIEFETESFAFVLSLKIVISDHTPLKISKPFPFLVMTGYELKERVVKSWEHCTDYRFTGKIDEAATYRLVEFDMGW